MDPVHLAIAIGPLALYFLGLGILNARQHGLVTTGTRDLAAVGLAVSGMALAGPLELFLPKQAVANYGVFAWLLLVVLYGLGLTMILLLTRPRLVIYNVDAVEFRSLLGRIGKELDPETRWAGDTLFMPTIGVQCYLESLPSLRQTQLMPSGPRQHWPGWRKLQRQLAENLPSLTAKRNPYAYALLSAGTASIVVLLFWLLVDWAATQDAFLRMFYLS